jgi:ornithine carbamoyltransferase
MGVTVMRHFLRVSDLTPARLQDWLDLAVALKRRPDPTLLAGRNLALVFQKPSLRTRVSFEIGMRQLGGHTLYLAPAEVGLGERESAADVARVLSRYVDGVVARTFAQADVDALAEWSDVPVINGLSDEEHPCQALADLLTIYERRGALAGARIAYVGDGNNIGCSLLLAAAIAGMDMSMACPPGYGPSESVRGRALGYAAESGANVRICSEPAEAVRGAEFVYTDVWTSMGQESERLLRQRAFGGFQVNAELLEAAGPRALVMHDLPAHRGEEITDEVIDGPRSIVFDQAENRLHAQKAVLARLLGP